MDRILAFILGVPLGFLIMIYRYKLKQLTGDIAWAEQYLGSGGTYNFFILLGLVVTILSIMYAFGSLQELTAGSVGMFFR